MKKLIPLLVQDGGNHYYNSYSTMVHIPEVRALIIPEGHTHTGISSHPSSPNEKEEQRP